MPKEEESETKYTFTPGLFDRGNKYAFEQVKNSKYAMSGCNKVPKQNEPFIQDSPFVTTSQPFAVLERVAWNLVEQPLNFGSQTDLWNEVKQFVFEHLFLPDQNLYDVLTAWIFATWIYEVWNVVPYIFFYGPVASGKTRGLEILHRLSYRAVLSSNISSAALFRACESWHPTLILDETEIYNKQEKNEIIGLLNSGYRRGQFAIRVRITPQGELLDVFDVFGFKAMAGTEGLAKTLESRSIMIRMIKNRRKVRLHIDEKKADELRAKLLFWRLMIMNGCELGELCEGFLKRVGDLDFDSGRLEELFQCLLAVANDGRENILAYAEKMNEMRLFEEATSIEAEVVEIMLNSDLGLFNNVILTKDVTEKYNASRVEREKVKTGYVGWAIRRLGFEPRHTRQGNGWLFDRERLSYLKQIYLGEPSMHQYALGEPSLVKKGSQGSQGSQSMDVDVMESVKDVKDVNLFPQPNLEGSQTTCFLCLKALPIDHVDTTYLDGKEVHLPCMRKFEEGRKSEQEFNPNLYGAT